MNKLKNLDSNIDTYILQYFHQLSYSYGDLHFLLMILHNVFVQK